MLQQIKTLIEHRVNQYVDEHDVNCGKIIRKNAA